jgi:LmbE family N-acetylglucosaminyl deacetylase
MPDPSSSAPVVLAAAAHPDDIEFRMAGTLLLLRKAGCEIHMWNLANGCCGSMILSPQDAVAERVQEARSSALIADAKFHGPLFADMNIFYDGPSLRKVAARIRSIQPDIILTHPLSDYMEDHQNTARLVVSAAFGRNMPNLPTDPPTPYYEKNTAIYHALPHGLKGPMREDVRPEFLVDISQMAEMKRHMLSCHESQKSWLDKTQGMGSFIKTMEDQDRNTAERFSSFSMAEGWSRHSHLGFAGEDFDPLRTLIDPKLVHNL